MTRRTRWAGIWSERWTGWIEPRALRRRLDGGPPLPRWIPGRLLTVVSADVDAEAGVAALWLVTRPGSAKARGHTALFERDRDAWVTVSGGSGGGEGEPPVRRAAAGEPGQVGMFELHGGGGIMSAVFRREHHDDPEALLDAPTVGDFIVRAASEVDHLLVGRRRVGIPPHGAVIVAWRTASQGRRPGLRPHVVAVGRDGTRLSEMGPLEHVDSYTWSRLGE